eukprot:1154088-Pelagomonas_calceolata.AAC.12
MCRVNDAIFSRCLNVQFPDGHLVVLNRRDAQKAAAEQCMPQRKWGSSGHYLNSTSRSSAAVNGVTPFENFLLPRKWLISGIVFNIGSQNGYKHVFFSVPLPGLNNLRVVYLGSIAALLHPLATEWLCAYPWARSG